MKQANQNGLDYQGSGKSSIRDGKVIAECNRRLFAPIGSAIGLMAWNVTRLALPVLAVGLFMLSAGKLARAQTSTWNNTSVIFGANSMTTDTLGNSFATGIGEVGQAEELPYCYTVSYSRTGAVRWESIFQNFDAAMGLAVAGDGQGGAASVGFTYGFGPTGVQQVMLAVKYDSNGNQLWSNTYVGTNTNGSPSANAVVQDASGNVYVTGSVANNGTGDDIVTIKYDASTGATDWLKIWDDGAGGTDKGRGIALDGNGNVYVSGDGGNSGVLLKYSAASGSLIWVAANPSGGGKSIALSGNNVYVAAGSVRQFSASTGSAGWSTSSIGGISQVATDGAGDVFALGAYTFPYGQPAGGPVTIRLNPADGSILWQQSYSGNGTGGFAVSSAGNVYVTSVVNGTNVVAVKYSGSTGAQLNSYTSPAYLSSTTDFGIGLDGSGDAFIVGLTPTPGMNNNESSILAIGLLGF